MKVLVIGANGNTGTRVIRRLAMGSHEPVAMIRNPAHREKFDSLGVPTVLADLEYPIDHAVQGCDAIIFAAGSGGKTGKDKTVLIDHIGPGGYYAIYFRGPDRLKFEVVHMPLAEKQARSRGLLRER